MLGLTLRVSRNSLYVAPMLQKADVTISGLPEDLFNLPLKSLNIGYCKELPLDVIDTICQTMPQLASFDLSGLEMTGESQQFHVAPTYYI